MKQLSNYFSGCSCTLGYANKQTNKQNEHVCDFLLFSSFGGSGGCVFIVEFFGGIFIITEEILDCNGVFVALER